MEKMFKPILGKWKMEILRHLAEGPLRMSEIEHRIPEAHPRVLKRQIRSMEVDGILQKKTYDDEPHRVEYSLTEYGNDTLQMLYGIVENKATADILQKYGIIPPRKK